MIYNGYLSLDERCAISDVKKSYADAERLNMLYEAVELDYRINCLYAESKVLDTYGTYDDLEKMYTEASEQTSEKKLTILQRLVGFIESLFNKIKEFFLKKFKKEGDIEAPKDTEPAIKTLTDLWASLKGVVTQPSIESVLAVKDTVINLIDNHKKEFVAFNLAGAGAGAGLVVWKAAKKKAAADKLLETSNDVSKSMGKVKEFIRLARGTAGDITTHLLQLGIDKLKSAININDSELEKAKSGDESAKKGFAEKCRSAAIDVMQKILSALEWLLRQLQKIMNFLAGNGFVEGDSSIKKEPKPLPEGKTVKDLPEGKTTETPPKGKTAGTPPKGTPPKGKTAGTPPKGTLPEGKTAGTLPEGKTAGALPEGKTVGALPEGKTTIDDLQAKFDEFIKTAPRGATESYKQAWHWYKRQLNKGHKPNSKNYTPYKKNGNKAPKNWIKKLENMGIKVESAAIFFIESGGLGDHLFESFMDSVVELYREHVTTFDDDWEYISSI